MDFENIAPTEPNTDKLSGNNEAKLLVLGTNYSFGIAAPGSKQTKNTQIITATFKSDYFESEFGATRNSYSLNISPNLPTCGFKLNLQPLSSDLNINYNKFFRLPFNVANANIMAGINTSNCTSTAGIKFTAPFFSSPSSASVVIYGTGLLGTGCSLPHIKSAKFSFCVGGMPIAAAVQVEKSLKDGVNVNFAGRLTLPFLSAALIFSPQTLDATVRFLGIIPRAKMNIDISATNKCGNYAVGAVSSTIKGTCVGFAADTNGKLRGEMSRIIGGANVKITASSSISNLRDPILGIYFTFRN